MSDECTGDIFSLPKDIVFPDELNRHLKEQILGYIQQNAILRKSLSDSETKCSRIQKEMDDIKTKLREKDDPVLPQFASSSQSINTKIVELSKNYRDKCAELEKYKTKYSKLACRLEEFKRKENQDTRKDTELPNQNPSKPDSEKLNEIKLLQEKLNTTTNKMLEFKNLNIQMKNEVRQMNKLLQQETGEDFQTLQNSLSWKGRAQIICDLQEKNRKLRDKLKIMQDHGPTFEIRNSNEKISSKVSTLEKEIVDLKSQVEVYKTRVDTLKSRCAMLETEQQELKMKIQSLKKMSDKDFDTITNLSNQVAQAEEVKKCAVREKEIEISKIKLQIQNITSQLETYKELVNTYQEKVKNLNDPNIIKDIERESTKNKEREKLQVTIQDLKEDKQKLLDLVNLHMTRLEDERNEHERCKQLLRIEKQRSAKSEIFLAKYELESGMTNRSRYSTISLPSRITENSLRNQLEIAEESIKALQTRLELEQNEKKRDFQEFAKILSTSK